MDNSNALVTQLRDVPAEWEAKIDLIKRTVAANATNDELELFFHQAKRCGLDPLAKQIYFVKRKGQGTFQVGIDGFRVIAHRTGACAGIEDAEFAGTTPDGYPSKARVTVYKLVAGQRCPFTATARWDEYYPGQEMGFMWRKLPHTMLAKCAEALALRKAFPADLSGMYVAEEMMQADAPDHYSGRVNTSTGEVITPELVPDPLPAREAPEAKEMPHVNPPSAATAPDGKDAFGYRPVRWPLAKMFAEPMTDSQRKAIGAKANERTIPEEDLNTVRRLVLEHYGLADEATKACASLFIDWLINADEDTLDAACDAADKARYPAPADAPADDTANVLEDGNMASDPAAASKTGITDMYLGHKAKGIPTLKSLTLDPTEAQLKAMLAICHAIGLGDDTERYHAIESIARGYGAYAGPKLHSSKDLSKGAASMVLDFLTAAEKDPALLASFKEELARANGQDALGI